MQLPEAQKLVEEQLMKHGLTDWKFCFDRAKCRFGLCIHSRKTIRLSKHLVLLNEEKQVYDTVIHEIAHALVGSGHGHDRAWRAKAKELGHTGKRCYSSTEVVEPKHKFTGKCPRCGHIILRNTRRDIACNECCNIYNHGRFSLEFKFVWTQN